MHSANPVTVRSVTTVITLEMFDAFVNQVVREGGGVGYLQIQREKEKLEREFVCWLVA